MSTKSQSQNPWQREGVSILPGDLADLMPIVGQQKLFKRLERFRNDIISPAGQDLAGFFMVIGGWGVGKSRVGHEICLEACSDEVHWILDGARHRILESSLKQGILPLFLRYIQVTKGPLGANIEADSWIPRVTVEVLSQLAKLRTSGSGNRLVRNQDRLLELARTALSPKGWDRELSRLQQALQKRDPHEAARTALVVLKDIGVNHLWIVVDEIEDITDVERDGLPSSEREGIDQGLLTVIPRVIKAEESRQEFPEVNFLLLCSLAVGDLLKQIRAIERRTGWHELTTNTFADVEAFFTYLKAHRPAVGQAIAKYPSGLKEAAFFAANRNFGWFNVIMHHAHENHRGGTVETPALLRMFADVPGKGDKSSVFDLGAISDYRVPKDKDYDEVVRSIFGLLPRPIGSSEGVTRALADRLFSKRDHGGKQKPLFTPVVEIKPPPKHRVMAHLINCGFKPGATGTELILPGEARFDLEVVWESLRAYTIGLPDEARREEHLLICTEESEFTHQVSGLSPYTEQAAQFAPFLHGMLTDPAYRVKDEQGKDLEFVAPAFSFLLDFNRLNRVRQAEEGYLRDSAKNSALEEAFRKASASPEQRSALLLRGIANAWDTEHAPIAVELISNLKLPSAKWSSSHPPLNLGKGGEVIVLYAASASESDLEHDLMRLAQGAAAPVLVILEDQEQRLAALRAKIERSLPKIAPFVILHNLARQTAGHLLRLGLMGTAFTAEDLRTSHFHAVVGVAKEHIKRSLDGWLEEQVERQGLLIKPLFYGSKINDDDMRAFAKGYAALLEGKTKHDVLQTSNGIFADEAELDVFKKMASRHTEPGPKFAGCPRTELLEGDDFSPNVPRNMYAILEACGPVAVQRADLERRFLFALRDRDNGLVANPRDVVRHYTDFLVNLGLLEADGDKLIRVSGHQLEIRVKAAEEWLDGAFEKDGRAIKAVHDDAGENLLNVRAKDARHRLKAAKNRLEELSLDFIGRPWAELNKNTADGVLFYEQRLRSVIQVVRSVRATVQWVYDPGPLGDFRYSSDALREFDAHEKSPSYPLWKRIAVLKGFYETMEKRRRELTKRIDDTVAEVGRRVPVLASGPEAGQQAFPTQALSLPLELYRKELNFNASNPQATVAAGGTTLGITTVGFKIASARYLEALERVDVIESELVAPGKLVASFLEILKVWEGLREDVRKIRDQLKAIEMFFADAPPSVIANIDLASIRRSASELQSAVEEGGIRDGTDSREVAGTPVLQLVDGLEDDIAKLRDLPRQLRERLVEVEQQVVPSLGEQYQRKYGGRLAALTRIRKAQGKDLPTWPDRKGATYAATVALFDEVVRQIDAEGEAFFKGCGATTFAVFVGFCDLANANLPIDWNASEHKRHVSVLMEKGLLELRLV
ncbi:hypothetical protein BON30_24150 [Cystobacter ferrugineus]|uniref:Uncharacterized protein n=1 Tax=Cystobacter ferrugineus TaxID=83449 RepID=A0A1L9B7M1_9BACT|nr:hypothetical protein BON30_24150 [Cystobacter ferrugineus]